jgi:multicomponent Na+:H+ antiporter subunit B
MNSLILKTTARLLLTLLMMFSVFLLLRGHDHPGGGFAAGLVATTAWALYGIAFGVKQTRKALRFDPQTIVGLGLMISLLSGLIPLLAGRPLLTGLWFYPHLGTPVLFDIGVFLVILGVALTIIFALEENN